MCERQVPQEEIFEENIALLPEGGNQGLYRHHGILGQHGLYRLHNKLETNII